ncbi:MAG: RdgB/HAM1 family non-canonical purine NTP pyrophosphatase [Propionibacteriaceae bacterium]|nr:RdgB/HAM1 family non-canonical purine NTP pyrophosphatase [Propionibacteriaceae bacterium]
MSARLLLASGNAHKLSELRRLVAGAGLDLTVSGLSDLACWSDPVEDGATFEDNALIKAEAGHRATGGAVLADDSGLEVDVLGRMPGVRSARWAGPGASDQDNLDLVLRQLADVEPARRGARFVCAVALVQPTRPPVVLRRAVEGVVLTSPRGENGFGYDPIFLPDGFDLTTAEMSAAQKDAISHRGQALRALLPDLALIGADSD